MSRKDPTQGASTARSRRETAAPYRSTFPKWLKVFSFGIDIDIEVDTHSNFAVGTAPSPELPYRLEYIKYDTSGM